MIKNRIWKRFKKIIILLLILTTIGITFFQINNYNTVRAGGQIRAMWMEKFWNGNRFYLLLERDNDNCVREYEISEKDYYSLEKKYIIIFMDGHIETLKEFKKMKEFRKNTDLDKIFSDIIKIPKQIDKMPEYAKYIIYFFGILIVIIVVGVILINIYRWRKISCINTYNFYQFFRIEGGNSQSSTYF